MDLAYAIKQRNQKLLTGKHTNKSVNIPLIIIIIIIIYLHIYNLPKLIINSYEKKYQFKTLKM